MPSQAQEASSLDLFNCQRRIWNVLLGKGAFVSLSTTILTNGYKALSANLAYILSCCVDHGVLNEWFADHVKLTTRIG
jgi:hypothetical protein